MIATSEAM